MKMGTAASRRRYDAGAGVTSIHTALLTDPDATWEEKTPSEFLVFHPGALRDALFVLFRDGVTNNSR